MRKILTSLDAVVDFLGNRSLEQASRSPLSILRANEEAPAAGLALDNLQGAPTVIDKGRAYAEFRITTPALDRHGDRVRPRGVEKWLPVYHANPRVFFAHRSNELPIGSARHPDGTSSIRIEDDADYGGIYFHQKTQESSDVCALVMEKELEATSIGFLPHQAAILEAPEIEEVEDAEGRDIVTFCGEGLDFLEWEMFEFSVVPVPANREALAARMAKGLIKSHSVRTALTPYLPAKKIIVPGVALPYQVEAPPEDDTIRWNKSLSKAFDVSKVRLQPADAELALVSKFLGAKIKEIYETRTHIPAARMAGFLSAWQDTTEPFTLKDVRNILYNGSEAPPVYEELQCGSQNKRDFLIHGICFQSHKESSSPARMVSSIKPSLYGLSITHYVPKSDKAALLDLISETWELASEKYNYLKGEAFSLSGEFLPRTEESFDGLFLKDDNRKSLERTLRSLNTKQLDFANRGAIFLGPPGTGKTLSARILRNQAEATFIWVSARDFRYAGAFGSLDYAFGLAKELAPSILCLEDIDNWIDSYTIDMLKSAMDGIGRSAGIWTILTTNFPEDLPEALIDRPGRFHDVLEFNLPDKDCRRAMMARWLPEALDDATLTQALSATEGYSGAHVYELCHFARTLQEQEGHPLGEAVLLALDKIKKQRELIDRQGIRRKGFVMNKAIASEASDRLADFAPRRVVKVVVPYADHGKSPESTPWKASVEVKKAGDDLKMLKKMCAWYDAKNADKKSAFKLPHHKAGSLKAVWNGVRAAMGALLGARGGTKIPPSDRKGVYNHLSKHYKAFKKTPPDFHKSYTPEELEKLFGDVYPLIDEMTKTMPENLDREDPDTEDGAPEHEADPEDVQKMDSEQMEELHDLMKGMHEKLDALHEDHKALHEEHKALHEAHADLHEKHDALHEKHDALHEMAEGMHCSLEDLHEKLNALVEPDADGDHDGDEEEDGYDQELDDHHPASEEDDGENIYNSDREAREEDDEEDKEIDPQDEGRDRDGEERELNPDEDDGDDEEPEEDVGHKKKKKPKRARPDDAGDGEDESGTRVAASYKKRPQKSYSHRGSTDAATKKQLAETIQVVEILIDSQKQLQAELFKLTGKRKYAPRS